MAHGSTRKTNCYYAAWKRQQSPSPMAQAFVICNSYEPERAQVAWGTMEKQQGFIAT